MSEGLIMDFPGAVFGRLWNQSSVMERLSTGILVQSSKSLQQRTGLFPVLSTLGLFLMEKSKLKI